MKTLFHDADFLFLDRSEGHKTQHQNNQRKEGQQIVKLFFMRNLMQFGGVIKFDDEPIKLYNKIN